MAAAMAGMGGFIGAGASLASGINQAAADRAAGVSARRFAKYQQALYEANARQLREAGIAEQAKSQRVALQQREAANLVSGRARALAAASGATGGSPNIINALAKIGQRGDYNTALALWQGGEARRLLNYQAQTQTEMGAAARRTGEYQKEMSEQQAAATMQAAIGSAASQAFGGAGNVQAAQYGGTSTTPTSNTPTTYNPNTNTATMGGYQMGGSNTSYYSSPMYARYGQGGYQNTSAQNPSFNRSGWTNANTVNWI